MAMTRRGETVVQKPQIHNSNTTTKHKPICPKCYTPHLGGPEACPENVLDSVDKNTTSSHGKSQSDNTTTKHKPICPKCYTPHLGGPEACPSSVFDMGEMNATPDRE
jgi:hypothetical protein